MRPPTFNHEGEGYGYSDSRGNLPLLGIDRGLRAAPRQQSIASVPIGERQRLTPATALLAIGTTSTIRGGHKTSVRMVNRRSLECPRAIIAFPWVILSIT